MLIVTDEKILSIGIAKPMLEAMEKAELDYVVFSKIEPNPTDLNVEEGYRTFAENGCDCVVAFGGGSPMDCAKAICAKCTKPHKTVAELQGLLKVLKKTPVIFAVPKPPLQQL